ncbi:MAG: hypothetical protein AAGD13_07685 [Pseudomonadota bacterium]
MTMHEADIRRLGGKFRQSRRSAEARDDDKRLDEGSKARAESLAARAWGEPEDDDA